MSYGLFSFNPRSGTRPSVPYILPPVSGDDVRVMTINRGGNALTELEELTGAYPEAGTGPLFPSYAELTVTFDFIPPWLTLSLPGKTVYTADPAGIDKAIFDFYKSVVEGGEGTLTDNFYSSGTTVQTRTTQAWINGSITVTRPAGGTYAKIECTFVVPSGVWVMPDGTTVLFY